MLGVVGLMVLVLVGERIRRARARVALVRQLPKEEPKEDFVREDRAWRMGTDDESALLSGASRVTDRSNERLRLNHVRIGTADIERTVNWLFDEFGFASYHVMERPESGLSQWVTPLGRHVLEIFGIADRTKAGEQRYGLVAQGDVFLGWGVRTHDIDSVCRRLGLTPSDLVEWTDPNGAQWSLRSTGYEQMSKNPSLPYFLEYQERPELWPSHDITHRVEPEGIAWVEVGGDDQTIRDWLGDSELGTADLPVRLSPGEPGVKAIGIETASGISVLRLDSTRG